MIEIDDKIVSTDILTEHFACDIAKCKGQCCVDGNAGAPLEIDEVDILEQEYANYKRYMMPEGIESVERNGFMVVDCEGDYTTPLVGDAECVLRVPRPRDRMIQRGHAHFLRGNITAGFFHHVKLLLGGYLFAAIVYQSRKIRRVGVGKAVIFRQLFSLGSNIQTVCKSFFGKSYT